MVVELAGLHGLQLPRQPQLLCTFKGYKWTHLSVSCSSKSSINEQRGTEFEPDELKTKSCVLEQFHAEPMEIYSNQEDRKSQGH
jgi:hypothetical protein